MRPKLTEADLAAFEPEAKVGLLATLTDDGLPHLTLITSLCGRGHRGLLWGQFCEGLSKRHVRSRPRTGFLVMNAARSLWRGTAEWTGAEREGEDYVRLNVKPMFRYNAYFNIHTAHRMDLVSLEPRERLSVPAVAAGALAARAAAALARGDGPEAMNEWSRRHIDRPATLKLLAYVARDGFPRIVPALAAAAAGPSRLLVLPTACRAEVAAVPAGSTVALYALDLEMQSVLVRGAFSGLRRGTGTIEVDWVYNSMPPSHGQIHPPVPLEPVTSF